MKTYEKYKDSGIEWIGEIPEHWEIVPIKRLVGEEDTLFLDGNWIESKDIVFDTDEIRYITTGNIGEGVYKEQGLGYITQDTFDKLNCTEVFPYDLVISRLNPPIGRCCIIPDLGKRIVTSVDNVILRPNKKFNKEFLKYVLSNEKYFEHTSLIARGATMQRISRSLLGDVKIPITFNYPEQTIIAEFLDRKTAEIDRIIANKEKLIALYEEEKQAVINQVVTKGLDPSVQLKDSGVEWLGEIPEHWEQKNLKYLARVQTGGTPKIQNAKMDYFAEGNINWYTPSDFYNDGVLEDSKRKINDFAIEDSEVEIFSENSVFLVSIGATLGKVGLSKTKASANQQINVIIFNKSLVNPFYGYYFLVSNKEMIKLEADYTTLPILNQTKTKSLIIAYPDLNEQDKIVQYIDNKCRRINAVMEKFNKQIELLQEYRTTLISEVVTGKVKVSE